MEQNNIQYSNSSIKQFYQKKSIFITGATGFIGKVLLEKLLRSFPHLDSIFLLTRSSNTSSLLSSPPFTFHKLENTDKVKFIKGDLADPNLLQTLENNESLKTTVNIIFHVAASIRFDLPLSVHLANNALGTKTLIEFSLKCTNLSAFIYVSTAYSHCHRKDIDEIIYPLKLHHEVILNLLKNFSSSTIESLSSELLDGRPNGYVYSKAVGEHIINDYHENIKKSNNNHSLPSIAIIRPGVVGPSLNEPTEGWVDSIQGVAGLCILAGLGVIQTIDWKYDIHSDGIPVDYLVNGLITSAWFICKKKQQKLTIFNFTSSNIRPMSNGDFMTLGRSETIKRPSMYFIRPHMTVPKKRPNPIVYRINRFVYHTLFAYFIDFLLVLFGYKRIMVKIVNKMHKAIDLMQYFILNEWHFISKNYLELMESIKEEELDEFDFDLRKVDEKEGIRKCWLGCRRYILKEDDSTIDLARKKWFIIVIVYYVFQVLLFFLILKLIWNYGILFHL